ncbi:hypothetical protein Dimus_039015 [Dionaea muscipula]
MQSKLASMIGYFYILSDGGRPLIPRFHEVVTLENLENHRIATIDHPRKVWEEVRELYSHYLGQNETGHFIEEISNDSNEEEDDSKDDDGGDVDDADYEDVIDTD